MCCELRRGHVIPGCSLQIDIVNPEAYHYDGDCIAKAADMGFPGLVDIRQRQVQDPGSSPLRTALPCFSQLMPLHHANMHDCSVHGS